MHLGKLVDIDNSDDPKDPKIVYMGDVLDDLERSKSTSILYRYSNIFAFKYQDIPSMDPNIVVHNIVTHHDTNPVKKKPHKVNPYKSLHIKYELQNLLDSKFIFPIDYPQWVSKMVPINKP